jgi:hypothetical protein
LPITKLHGRQRRPRFDLQHRKIGLRVRSDELGFQLGAIGKIDLDVVCALDHVVVGDDITRWIDDEAGAERADIVVAAWAALLLIEEVVEEFLERRAVRCARRRAGTFIALDVLRGGDVHHRIEKPFSKVGNRGRTIQRRRALRFSGAGKANICQKCNPGQESERSSEGRACRGGHQASSYGSKRQSDHQHRAE